MTADRLTGDDLRPHRGDAFAVEAGAHHSSAPPMVLELAEVSEGADEQVTLVFVGPAAPALEQGTYRLTHDTLGVLELFLVPLGAASGAAGDGMRYETALT